MRIDHGVQIAGAFFGQRSGQGCAQGFQGGRKGVRIFQAYGQIEAQEGDAVGFAQIRAGGIFLRAEGGQLQGYARPGHEADAGKGRAVLGQAVVGFFVAAVQILGEVGQEDVVQAAGIQQGLEGAGVRGGKVPGDNVDAAVGRGVHGRVAHNGVQRTEKAFVLRSAVAR